jgi:hypothetical protein
MEDLNVSKEAEASSLEEVQTDEAALDTSEEESILREEESLLREEEDPSTEEEEAISAQPTEEDYARLAEEDLAEIKRLDPTYLALSHLSQLPFARRFAALRDMGLSVREALAASNPRFPKENGKAHLLPSASKGASSPLGTLSGEEMRHAKALFSDLTDAEIQKLYRRVKSTYSY